MSVFDSLAREHELLLRLVGRLERAAAEPDARAAVRETRGILLVLLKALEAHEGLEHQIFEESPEAPSPSAYKALAGVESQHRTLAALREEASALLGGITPDGGEPIRDLALRLARLLRRHFAEEERTLWPSFNAYAGRSTLHRLSRQAREQALAMQLEVETYMTGGR